MTDLDDRQLGRRDLLKRSALVGGALVWTTPIVQSIGGTALATEASDGGNGAPSYVFVWFQCGTTYHAVKYGQNGSAEQCGATKQHVSSDASAAVKAQFDAIYAAYGLYSGSCPSGVSSSLSGDGDLLISLGTSGCTVVNWFLHDGSCKKTGDDKFRWKGDGETPAVGFVNGGGGSWEFQKCND